MTEETHHSAETAFAQGTEDALRLAYDAHGSLVYSFSRRRVGDEVAADITQEVFVSAWRSRERFDPERGALAAWLITIAKRKIIDHYRYTGRRPKLVGGSGSDDAAVADDPTNDMDAVAERMLLAAALAELPERSRTMTELHFYEQLTHNEISEKTGVPLGTVKSDIRRSLTRLRRYVEAYDE